MKLLVTYIKSKIEISDDNLDAILLCFKEKQILKERFLIRQGQIADNYFFIVSGGLSVNYEHDGKQITAWVGLENTFFTDLTSLKTNSPCRFNIQAIEDTKVLYIHRADMERMYKQFPEWQEFGRKVWEDAFVNVMEGALRFQSMSAEDRYLTEMQQSELLQRIPLKQLASFLGITPTSLSRLRKNIK
jgi:CRP-like cAMP-binding protein